MIIGKDFGDKKKRVSATSAKDSLRPKMMTKIILKIKVSCSQ